MFSAHEPTGGLVPRKNKNAGPKIDKGPRSAGMAGMEHELHGAWKRLHAHKQTAITATVKPPRQRKRTTK